MPGTWADTPLANVVAGTCSRRDALASTAPEVTTPSSVAMLGGLPLLAATAAGSTDTTARDL